MLATGAECAGGTPPGKMTEFKSGGEATEGGREDLNGGLCRGIKGPVSDVNGESKKERPCLEKWGEWIWDTGDWICNFSEERPYV